MVEIAELVKALSDPGHVGTNPVIAITFGQNFTIIIRAAEIAQLAKKTGLVTLRTGV